MPDIHCHYCGGSHSSALQVKACASRHQFRVISRQPTVPATPRSIPVEVHTEQPLPPRTPRPTFANWISKIGIRNGETNRYALPGKQGGADIVRLYELRRTERGFVFVNRVTSHGGTAIDVTKHEQADVLHAISRDPLAAELLYGQTTEHCSDCGKFLRVPESVQRGKGPKCWAKAQGRSA